MTSFSVGWLPAGRTAGLGLCVVGVLLGGTDAWGDPRPAAPAVAPGTETRVLIVTGLDYPGHLWRETTPILAGQLRQDPRLEVSTVSDPEFLASPDFRGYRVVVLHYMNWERPSPSLEARENLRRFVADGGGLVLVHFACGAFQDWPEFAELAGRVWDPKLRGHDPRGPFEVRIADSTHPITQGLSTFKTDDELYTCLAGDRPIQLLATARSSVDGLDYPMAFVLHYGKGRVFHSPLGHDVKALSPVPVGELFRRGCAWAAGLSAAVPTAPVSARASCSSLAQLKQPTEVALRKIAELGYRWVDLSCLGWAPHADAAKLAADFEPEAARVEAALARNGLRVSNLTFDGMEARPFEEYVRQFSAVVRLAARLQARVVNIMAPPADANWSEVVPRLLELARVAADCGVVLTLETHVNQVTQRPDDALRLCRTVPGLGLTLDPSHYFAGPNQGAGFDSLLSSVQGTGFRAGGMSWETIQLPWGEGPIDFDALINKLEGVGYRGFYVAEYLEGFNQLDALAESRAFLEWIRRVRTSAR